jgi:hypothetical protein
MASAELPDRARTRRRWRRLGRALYLVVVQATVGVAAAALGLYLAVNSPSFAPYLGHAISAALPGEVRVHWLRLGPSPGHVELRHVLVRAPDGHQVLAVRSLVAELDLLRLLQSLALGGERVLQFDELRIDGGDLRLDEDDRGRLRLPLAFSDPNEPPSSDGAAMRVALEHVGLNDTAVHIDLPQLRANTREARLHGNLLVQLRPATPAHVHWTLQDIALPYVEAAPPQLAGLPSLPPMALRAQVVEGGPEALRIRHLTGIAPASAGNWLSQPLPDFALTDLDLDLQIEPTVAVLGRDARMLASTRNAFLGALLGGSFDCVASIDGEFRQDVDGFWATGQMRAGGKLAGFEAAQVLGRVEVTANGPGELPVRVVARDLEVEAYGGHLRSPQLVYRMLPGPAELPFHLVDGHVTLDHLDVAAGLRSEAVALTGPGPDWLAGRMSGAMDVAVRTRLDPSRQPVVASEVALFADLELEREGAAHAEALPEVQAHGAVRVGMGPDRPLTVDLGHVLVHTGPDPGALAGREWLRADGRLALGGDDTDLELAANIPHLRHLLGPAGVDEVDGELELSQTRLTGALDRPDAAGALRVRRLTARGHEVRSLQSDLRVSQGELTLGHLVADSDLALVHADVHLTLGAQKRLRVEHLKIDGIDLAHDLAPFGVREVAGHLGLQRGSVRLDLADWQHSLAFEGDLWGKDVVVRGHRLPELAGHLGAHGQTTRVEGADIRLWNDQIASLTAEYHLGSGRFEVNLQMPTVALAGVHALAGLPVRGSVAGHIEARGDQHGLTLDSRLQVRGLGWNEIELGDADLHIDKRHGAPAVIDADRFFPRFRLLSGSAVAFAGLKPLQMVLRIASQGRFDPFALLGLERPAGTTASLELDTTTTLDFRAGHAPYRVDARLEPGGLDVDLGAQQGMRNTSPVTVTVTPGQVTFGSSFFELGREQLELCGSVGLPGDGRPPELALFAAGAIDVPRVGLLAQTVAVLDLRLDLETAAAADADLRSACLSSGRNRGRLRLEGPLDALRIDGLLRTRASHITPRRFGHEIGIAAGGQFALASAGDQLTVSIPRDSTLTGTFDDGRWTAWGTAMLDRLQPETVDLFMSGTEIPWSAPKEYAVTVSPDLVFRGRKLTNPATRTMVLQGKADVKDGAYYRNFDKLGGIIGNAGDRQVDAVSTPLQEILPWLREVDLNLDVRGVDFEFNSKFVALKFDLVLDMDLNVRGSMFEPRVYKRVRVKDGSGSQVHYALNRIVFDVLRGNLDFQGDPAKPYLDLLLKADIPVRTASVATRAQLGVGADLQDTAQQSDVVTIFVTVEGIYGTPSFKLGFSSNQGDSESDVQYILLTGHRRTEASGAGPQIGISALVGVSAQDLVSRLLGKDVLDVNTEFDPTSNAVAAEVSKRLGKQITLSVKALSGREQQRYSAQFQFRLNDLLSFNGLWRRQQFTIGGLAEQPVDVYDFKLRYRMPLE